MLSRRHLRTRVMQALYSWYQSEDKNTRIHLQELFRGADRTYDLYLSLLQVMVEVADEEDRYYTDLQPRHIAVSEPVVTKFTDNIFIGWLRTDPGFLDGLKQRKISWQKDTELVKKVFYQLRTSAEYKNYVAQSSHTPEEDVQFCKWFYKQIIVGSEALQNTMEEQNIWWAEALDHINNMVLKTIRAGKNDRFELMPLFKDVEEDKEFMERLFTETIKNDDYFEKLISEKTKNWDVERIALMDIILLKMSLSEILGFPGIPVKVSINEYIDISKDFSTPKSKVFINGVIDNLVADLKSQGAVKKSGRGLIE